MRRKVSVIGAGNVGASVAQYLAQKNLCDIVIVDIPEKEDMPKGKALDLMEAGPVASPACTVRWRPCSLAQRKASHWTR